MVQMQSKLRAHSLFALLFALLLSQSLSAKPFRFAVINERPDKPDHAINQYNLFHKHLKQTLSSQDLILDDLIIANSIDELTKLLSHGRVDAFLEGVMPIIEIQQSVPIDLGVLAWRKQQREYFSVFFVRKDSGIHDLGALGSKTIIFESNRSTSAYQVPKLTLQGLGYSLNTAASDKIHNHIRYRFSGTESNQAYWVHKKKGDIGAFNNGDWERVPKVIRKDLKIIG